MSLRCESRIARTIYNISIAVELSSAFTPAIIEGIAEISLERRVVDSGGGLILRNNNTARLSPIEDVFNGTTTFNTVAPLFEDQYQYVVGHNVGKGEGVRAERSEEGGLREDQNGI